MRIGMPYSIMLVRKIGLKKEENSKAMWFSSYGNKTSSS
jgi:hypothetical protein